MTDANPFDALSQKSGQQPTATPEPNPFDAFGVPEPALTQPPRPTPEQFAENAYEKGRGGQGGVFTHAAEVYQQKREERIVSRADTEGVAQPGDVFSSKPTQSEVDLAIANLAARKAEYDKLYSFPEPQTWDEKLGSVSGSLNAGLTAPENLLPISRVGKAIQVAGETRGLGEVASNIMGRAAEVGVFSGSLDLAEQGLDIAAGHQKSIDEARLLWSTALGAGFGGSMPAMAALAKSYKGHFPTQINYWETQPISARQSEFISQEGKSAGVAPGKAAGEAAPIPDNDVSIDAALGPTISDGGQVSVRPSPAPTTAIPPGINPPRSDDGNVGDILGRAETGQVPGSATEAPTQAASTEATNVAGSMEKPPGESPVGSEPAPPAQPKTSIEDVKLAAEDYRQSLIAAITEAADKASGINKGTKYKAYTTGFEAGLRDGVEPKSAAGKAGFAAGKSYLATEEGKALLEKRNKANDLEINYKKDIGEWYDQTQLSDFKTWFSTSKVVDKSGKPAIYYHATKGGNDFDVFRAKQAGAIFASPNPKFTSYFHGSSSASGGSVYPVYIKALNPFDYQNKDQVDALISLLLKTEKFKNSGETYLRNKIIGKNEKGNWGFIEEEVVQKAIKELNHDGFYIFETLQGVRAKNIAVYEPTQIKSAIGNKGTFNPKDPRITHFKIGDDVESLKLGNEILPTNADTLETKFPKKGIAGDVNDVRISNRGMMPRELAPEYGGVSAKEELNHRLNESMREIATSLGLKFGIYDRNYNIRTALGTYNTRVGEIHIRYFGDLPVFIHELGHAMDYWMKGDSRTRDAWGAFIQKNFNELVWLDLNWQIGGMKGNPSIAEGVAEFMRAFVTNPAFAQNKAPNAFADLMSVISLAPEVESALARVQSLAHIESKLEPTQVFTTMVAEHPGFSTGFGKRVGGGLKPGDLKPSAIMKNLRKNGVVTTFTDYVHAIYTSVVGSDHAFSRYMDAINDALFYATGKPLELTFSQDPYVRYRMLPGAEQESSAAVMYGWKPYGASSGQPMSPSLQGALQKAFNGSLSRLENEGDPIVRAFNGYLIARRAITEWKRWEAGELLSQPVRASKNETIRAIADFEAAYPQFKDAANDIFAFRRAQFNRSVDAGIVSYELAEKILSNEIDHVPFWRDFTDEHAGSGGGSSANLEYSPIRQFHGSTRDILNPIMSIIEDASMHSRTIAINDVYRAIDRMVKRLGDAGAAFWVRRPNSVIRANSIDIEEAITNLARVRGVSEDDAAEIIRNLQGMLGEDLSAKIFRPEEIKADGKKVLFFFEAGKRVAVEVGDTKISKDFFDLMSNTSKSQFDFLLNTAEILNGLFQSSIVHAPRFMIGTMVRDNMTRSFIPRYMGMLGRVPPVQDITGLYTLLFNRSFADALASGGLIKGGVVSHAVRDFSSGDLTHAMKGMTAKNWREAPRAFLWNTTLDRLNAADGNPLKIAKALTFDTVWGAVKSGIGLIESGETISRVGVARLTYKYLKKQGLTDEEALRGAIFEANDMLDYSRKGSATNAATKLVPFLNPGIQGVDRSLRSSVAEPLRAIAKMRDRGGYANLDAKDKNAISAWQKNLMMFSLYAGAYLTYKQTIKDEPFYQQASPQRKKDYMLFPLGEDKYGTPVGVTLRKPLDWPGAVLNMMEDFIDELEESDPINWDKISHSLKEGIIPRQFQSFDALLSASPIPKTAYEVALNTKFGAPGTSPQPIVPPEIAEKGSPAEQFSNYTSDIAKFIGRELNVSPMVVDHVIRSAGTSAQDITDLSTAVVGDNPIVTPSEALTRFFFGAIYRQQRGAPAYRADMQDLVAKDHGTYQIQANAYLSALKDGDEFKAEQVYNRADDGAKTFMLIQSSSNFSSEIQQLHPLEHSQAIARVMHGLMSRLPEKLVEIHSERYEKGAAHKVIKIDRDQAKLLDTQFNMIVAEETRNGLTLMKQPGYDSFEVKDTTPRLEIIRHISPEVADEVEAVLTKAHILPATAIKAVWPEVKDRLLKDKSNAYLGDLQLKAKFGAELMPRMLVQ